MPWWGWLAIFVGGLVLVVIVRGALANRPSHAPAEREGLGSFVYYVLFDVIFDRIAECFSMWRRSGATPERRRSRQHDPAP